MKRLLFLIAGLAAAQNPVLRDLSCADAGSNDTYACSFAVAPSGYVTGMRYLFKANTISTGAATINFNSLGAKTIKKSRGGVTVDLIDGDIQAGQWVAVVYDGTNMQMLSDRGGIVVTDIGATFDAGAGSALSGGSTMCKHYAFPFTVRKATLTANVSASATVDVRTVAYASWTGAASASSITASATPAISSATKYQDGTLTGWTVTHAAETQVCYVLSSPATAQWVTLSLEVSVP
jgi:hypothetical protein